MKPFEERFTAWVDGQLTGEELAAFEKDLAALPAAAAEADAARRLGELLRRTPTAPPLANPDFFNLQLLQRLAAEKPRVTEAPHRGLARGFWSLPRLAWAGAFCLLVAAGLYRATQPDNPAVEQGAPYFAQVIEAWPSDPSITASTVYNPRDNVTVLWLDGLDYIPASEKLQ